MSTTIPIGSNSAAASPAGGASSPLGGLTMNNFLTLMTAQLKNQDPLSPTDSNQFLAQLSELSTVQGISQMNTTMTNLSTSLMSSQALASASLVGKSVLTAGSAASYTAGGTLSGAVQVPGGASSVTLTITNAAGAIVDQMQVPPGSGLQGFSWNGSALNGTALPSGDYGVTATAVVGGQTQAAPTLLNGTVQSVSLATSSSGVMLNTAELGPVALTAVQQIY
ncbi:MAG TPA: flagellar hook capping FlgD N-terminal domain-containing protein [Steroidobacteraceae bacterium]|nr:flagellar hook capping FlgD N-terminal domain-containing protein [Steroidobacteraceae bacterium]